MKQLTQDEKKIRAYVSSYNSYSTHTTIEGFYAGLFLKYPNIKQQVEDDQLTYDRIIGDMVSKKSSVQLENELQAQTKLQI